MFFLNIADLVMNLINIVRFFLKLAYFITSKTMGYLNNLSDK